MTPDRTTTLDRFDRASWAILGAVVLILLLSVLLAAYRLSLPTDGREFLDPPELGLVFEDDAVLAAIDGVPVRDVVWGAITFRPRRPANWTAGQRVVYTFRDGTTREYALRPSLSSPDTTSVWEWLGIAILLPPLLLGCFVFFRRPRSLATRILFLYGTLPVATTIAGLAANGWTELRLTDLLSGAYWPTLFFNRLETAILPLLLHFLLIFPVEKKPWRRHPRLVTVALYGSILFTLGSVPGEPLTFWLGELAQLLALLWNLVILVGIILSAGHTWLSLRDPSGRVRTPWVAWAIAVLLLGFFVILLTILAAIAILASGVESGTEQLVQQGLVLLLSGVSLFSFAAFALFLTVAVIRYRLFGIDLLLNRALVYGSLTGIVVALYVLVVGALGALFQAQRSLAVSILATGLIAVSFQPLRERLQQGVNRLMYGERDDPVAVLLRLGQRLEATLATESVLPTLVETLAQALKLPYAAVALRRGAALETVAVHGQPVEDTTSLPLVYQGETIGCLILAPRAPGEDFTPGDWRLLESVARQAGTVAHAVRLAADLRRGRGGLGAAGGRLVAAREEERRRLRRDLHDGLGPQLAGLTLKLDAARNLLARDPAAVDALLLELKDQAQTAIADIRRLVYDLRPPALDQLGLVTALREHALTRKTLNGPQVVVEASEPWPALPAAVEVAAYRIALEALTNVERHARARRCIVSLTLDDALQLEIADDGVGLPPGYQAGVGLTSMHERAAELGGTCTVEPTPGGGTRVLARLPLVRET